MKLQSILCLPFFIVMFCFGASSAAAKAPPTVTFPGHDKADLWFVGGQSNALGQCANRIEPFKPDPKILFFCADNQWRLFREPLLRYSFPHGDVYGAVDRRDTDPAGDQSKGASPVFFFAQHLLKYIDRHVALVDTDTGGAMAEAWDPNLKQNRPSYYIYDRMIEHIKAAGGFGRLKGIIWYQGESDVIWTPDDAQVYADVLARFVDRLRADTQNPDLPFIHVQIARYTANNFPGQPGASYKGEKYADLFQTYTNAWDMVQEAQRRLADRRENVYMISAVDLYPMADIVHLDYAAQQRLGRRLAEVALANVYKLPGHANPIKLASIDVHDSSIVVHYSGVNGRLTAPGRPHGFEVRFPKLTAAQLNAGHSNPAIYQVEFLPDDPAAVLLKCAAPINLDLNPVLYYGAGMNPYCNITDEKDIPLPAFGPLEIPMPAR